MTTKTGRKRYNRRDINSTLEAAIQHSTSTGTAVYVFPTAGGLVIDREPAPFGNRCYKVAGGTVERVGAW